MTEVRAAVAFVGRGLVGRRELSKGTEMSYILIRVEVNYSLI